MVIQIPASFWCSGQLAQAKPVSCSNFPSTQIAAIRAKWFARLGPCSSRRCDFLLDKARREVAGVRCEGGEVNGAKVHNSGIVVEH